MKFKFWIILALVMSAAISATAQEEGQATKKKDARQLLQQLHEGTLIVRLQSNDRKIKELQRLIDSPDLNEKSKSRFRNMLKTTLADTRQEGLDMMVAFAGNYNFSKVLFIYDTASVSLKNGVAGGYFLNDSLETDPLLRLESKDWLLLYFRREAPANFFLLDEQLEPVRRPFPLPKRPILKKYQKAPFVVEDGNAELSGKKKKDTGFALIMSYNKKNQLKFFSVLINSWQNSLSKKL